jgi:hypothetical protein
MQQSAPLGTSSPVLIQGKALRFALLLGDPRVTSAISASCIEDTIDVLYPEARITCRLICEQTRLRCAFAATHLAPDGTTMELHHGDLVLDDGPTGSTGQREAVLRRLHAFHCAAAASRFRIGHQMVRPRPVPDASGGRGHRRLLPLRA